MTPSFGHPSSVYSDWRKRLAQLPTPLPTPFFLFSLTPLRAAVSELDALWQTVRIPVRSWYSCKTQPLAPLMRWWEKSGRGIEVVSEFEFRAARAAGFSVGAILINGPLKHTWLPRVAESGMQVNFDSLNEIRALAPRARRQHWRCGLRLLTDAEFNPEAPDLPTQFGLSPEELPVAVKLLRRHGVPVQMVHFHLRTNLASPKFYVAALQQAAELCAEYGIEPEIVDLGGGLPAPWVTHLSGGRLDSAFDLAEMPRILNRARAWFPRAREFWLENGRWLTARSGILVVRILDEKRRRGMRHLLCDGGRTLHALVANWEHHALLSIPSRRGPQVPTTVVGPTCMAFDQLARKPMPNGLRVGDCLVWLDAGAYHLSWETRFSHGRAAIYWDDGKRIRQVRAKESFAEWWGQWR